MEIEKIESNFIAEKIEAFLTVEKFEEFKKRLQTLATITFEKNELGRKEARSLSRKIGTLKTKITERFDDLIKSEKAKNDEFVKYLKELTTTKAKYLAECVEIQSTLKKDVDAFDFKIERQIEAMQATLRQYQSLDEVKNAKEALIKAYDVDWEEKRKDAEKLFTELHDKLIMQEGIIAQLEKERTEREKERFEREQERLAREREAHEKLIREQAERLAQGKEIELPPIPSLQQIQTTKPFQEHYIIQKPAEPEKPKEKYTLFFDTETTSPMPTKARIVQIGAIVLDDNGNEIEKLNVLVKQSNPIPPETIAIHGKTDEMCAEHGVELAEALQRFKSLYDNVDFVVAHNMPFDENVIRSEFERIGQSFEITKPKFDTMVLYKDIVKCPPTEKMIKAGYTAYKNPKLEEAYNFVFGKDFDNAHDALSDVTATMELFNHYKNINKKVIATMTSCGISQEQARLIAKMLSREDLTLYTQYDTLAVFKQVKDLQAEIAILKAENRHE